MRRSAFVLFFLVLALNAVSLRADAQAAEAATTRTFHIDAGGFASGFQPGDGNNTLIGAGTYADIHFSHWVQAELEGRWLQWNGYGGETEHNYFIGPRVPIRNWRQSTFYGKAMIGFARFNFPGSQNSSAWESTTAIAPGATWDYHMTRKVTIRVLDFEYQFWPRWNANSSFQTINPYGVSVGIAYRVF